VNPYQSVGRSIWQRSTRWRSALLRFFVLGVAFFLGGGIRVYPASAAEGEPASLFTPAQVIFEGTQNALYVLRSANEFPSPMMILTGVPCEQNPQACHQALEGRFEDAATSFREWLTLTEKRDLGQCGIASALFLDGDLVGAAKVFGWLATQSPKNPDVRMGLGNVFVELNQFALAKEQFDPLLTQPRHRAAAHNNLGNAYFKARRMEEALREYDKALSLDADLQPAMFNRASVFLLDEKPREAADLYRKVIQASPRLAPAYLYEGLSHLKAGASHLAAPALIRARELKLNTPILHLAIGMALQDSGLDEEAVSHLRKVQTQTPADERVYPLLSVSLVRLRRLDEAARTLEKGFELGPKDADSHFFLGMKLFLCEKPSDAVKHFLRAAAKGRRKPDTFFALGQALLQNGDVESAIRSLSLASRMSPESSEIHFALGIALFHDGNLNGAIRELRTSSTLDPKNKEARLVLMDLLRRKGDYPACAGAGRDVINDNPELVAPRFETALCQALAGQLDRASESLEDAMDHDLDGDEVLDIWKRLSILTDSGAAHPGARWLLAMIQERRGNWTAAIRAYERFLQVSPSQGWTQKAQEKIQELAPRDSSSASLPYRALR